MRLWHKDLIRGLPRQQLLGQWRECCCIARNIDVNGTPNHLLVNKIMNYPIGHFVCYTAFVCIEMHKRGYKVDTTKFCLNNSCLGISREELFEGWHNDRYMEQCYFNLQEKFDCGGILEDEWEKFERVYMNERYNYSEEDWEEIQKKGKLMP